MSDQHSLDHQTGFLHTLKAPLAGAALLLSMALIAPVFAGDSKDDEGRSNINIEFGDEDLLEKLKALDAEDLEDIRADLAEARIEIQEAIVEINEAREEVKSVPGGAAMFRASLNLASKTVTAQTREAFEGARAELNRAEAELRADESNMSADEFAETLSIIEMVRTELAEIEVLIGELADTMRV